MSTSSSKLRGSQQRAGWPASNEAARGALVGLIPLGLLLVAVLVVLALATFAHTLISTACTTWTESSLARGNRRSDRQGVSR